jgi:hypothetical protein
MASGDRQRTWFSEMVEHLRKEWRKDMPLPDFIALTAELDEMLYAIRKQRNIVPAMMWCRECQARVQQAEPKVSVRAAILSLQRFEIEDEKVVRQYEKQWHKFREANALDLYGNPPKTKLQLVMPHDHT